MTTGRSRFLDDETFEAISSSHLPWNLELEQGTSPRSARRGLGEPWVVGCRIGRMSGTRRRAELRDTPGEFVAVLMVHRGVETLQQRGMTATVGEGEAALWDGVRPVDCATGALLDKVTMFVPRAALAATFPRFESALARTLPASDHLRLLDSWLRVALRGGELGPGGRRTAGRMAVDLLAAALAGAADGRSGPRAVLLLQVQAFLDRNLGDPELTLDTVARANAISLRYLHQLFEGSGDTAREYLRRRRLDRARHLLETAPEMSMTDIAGTCGFDSPSAFSRAFRVRYGMPPRDARRAVVHAVSSSAR